MLSAFAQSAPLTPTAAAALTYGANSPDLEGVKHSHADARVLKQMNLKDPHPFLTVRARGIHGCTALRTCIVLRVITKLQIM